MYVTRTVGVAVSVLTRALTRNVIVCDQSVMHDAKITDFDQLTWLWYGCIKSMGVPWVEVTRGAAIM